MSHKRLDGSLMNHHSPLCHFRRCLYL